MGVYGVKRGLYRHYKGRLVVVFAVSRLESTMQPLAHYLELDNHESWTRTEVDFTEMLTPKGGGDLFPRFAWVRAATVSEILLGTLGESIEGATGVFTVLASDRHRFASVGKDDLLGQALEEARSRLRTQLENEALHGRIVTLCEDHAKGLADCRKSIDDLSGMHDAYVESVRTAMAEADKQQEAWKADVLAAVEKTKAARERYHQAEIARLSAELATARGGSSP
jgi:hypothetical protein